MTTTATDRIEKYVLLRAPRSRVWRALADAGEFGEWFGVKLQGPFTEGATVRGQITYPGYEHLTMEVLVEKLEPERYFAFRWHPAAIDPKADLEAEPTTLVEFRLSDVAEGTMLMIVESGYDQLPAARRDEAFRTNSEGWDIQLQNIKAHVAG